MMAFGFLGYLNFLSMNTADSRTVVISAVTGDWLHGGKPLPPPPLWSDSTEHKGSGDKTLTMLKLGLV